MTSPPKFNCFLSASFRSPDEKLVAFFRNLLKDHFNVLWAKADNKADLLEKILPQIRDSEVVFAIFSCRKKIGDEMTVPADVLIESGIAMAWGLEVYGFVEEGISEAQQGILRFSRKAYPRFNRRGLEKKRDEFSDYVLDVKDRIGKEVRQPYENTHVVKEVTIYSDGYGAIRSQHTIQFHSDTTDFFADLRFGGGRSALKDFTLPPFDELRSAGPSARKVNRPFFAYKIVKGAIDSHQVVLSELSALDPAMTDFRIQIRGPFKRNESLTYEWSFGAPNLFPVRLADLQPGKRRTDNDYIESDYQLPPNRVATFTFVLRFEDPVGVRPVPICEFVGPGDVIFSKETMNLQLSSMYTVYVCKLPVDMPHGRVRVRWQPKD